VASIRREHDDRRRQHGGASALTTAPNIERQHPRATAVRAHFTVSSPVRYVAAVDDEESSEEEDDSIPVTV